ncbi:tetratricopeptide repeat protein [Streptomyces sp. CB01881]|uniref:tetratricopeptide repeat protein n=1 Tax=Streptomyces sp. CB01881 TaxID=2078691 RepID=UPI001386FF1A|nr:tetratricopeptide repeat protein [Streptomyces sp. CB01881]
MKRGRLWTGLAAVAVVAGVVTGWSKLSSPDTSTAPTAPTAKSEAAASDGSAAMADALLQAGIKQGELNDFGGATRTFRQVLDLNPGNTLAWYNLGVIAQHDNRTAEAGMDYDNALKTDPAFQPALYNKAVLLEESDTDQAIEILQRIVAVDPKAATAYLHLGQALAKKGRDAEAEGAFGTAVRADPSLHQLVPERFQESAGAAPSPTPTSTQAGTSR